MREAFVEQLDSIRDDLITMARLVRTAVAAGTEALLEGDAAKAERVISDDAQIDALREKLEELMEAITMAVIQMRHLR